MMKANMIVLAIALIMSLCFDPIKAKKSWLKVLGLVIPPITCNNNFSASWPSFGISLWL